MKDLFELVAWRPATWCNFLEVPEMREKLNLLRDIPADEFKVVYRNYATLYFVFIVDGVESELGILDLIQVSLWKPIL